MLDFLNGTILNWLDLYGTAATVLWCFWSFVLGGCFGSFTTACVWRIPRGISIVWPPSSCPKCGRHLGLTENIPIFGWLLLRGKCKGCGLPISPRYVLIELAAALLFTATAYLAVIHRIPLSVIPAWCLIVLCIGSACTDCELRIIPDKFTFTGMILALICAFLFPSTKMPSNMTPLFALTYTFAQIAAVGLFGYSAWYAGKVLFRKEALGRGDVKFLMAVAGFTSVFGALVTILTGSFLALIWLFCDAVKRGKLRRKFAYGPFLAAGAILWLLFKHTVMSLFLK